jgi:hypothetical protein
VKLKEILLWDVERASLIYLLFILLLAVLLVLIHGAPPPAAKGVVVKRLEPDLYFIGFDPSAKLSAAERSPEILVRTAANLRKRTGLKTLTPLDNGPYLTAILLSREARPQLVEPQLAADSTAN